MNTRKIKETLKDTEDYSEIIETLEKSGFDTEGIQPDTLTDILSQLIPGYNPPEKLQPPRIIIYDIETSFHMARVWSTGQMYLRHDQLIDTKKIITVAWKFLGDVEGKVIKWDGEDDRELMIEFLEAYNSSAMNIGFNNKSFDDKIVQSRAIAHGLYVNMDIKKYDVMRELKKVMNLPSYSMAYVSKFLHLGGKLEHTGIKLWEDIMYNKPGDKIYDTAMKLMCDYNVQDIELTEEIYRKLRPHLGHVIHYGALIGKGKDTCPNCGSEDYKLVHTTVTKAGNKQRIMHCNECKCHYKLSNTAYLKTL